MTTQGSEKRKWMSHAVETVALTAVALLLTVVLLPSAGRNINRYRSMDRISSVRRQLGGITGGIPAVLAASEGASLPGLEPLRPEITSWGNVGGCGVGGGGGGGGVRWVGRRAPGGVIEIENMNTYSAGEDLKSLSIGLKMMHEFHNQSRMTVGLSIPYLYNRRYDADYVAIVGKDEDLVVSSFGDLQLLASRKFGMMGSTVVNLTLGIPTAPYDVTQDGWHIPYDAQPGRGKLTLSLGAEQIVDKYYGPMIYGGSYNYNGGENDVGDYKSDTISAFYFISRRTPRTVHSGGITVSFAFEEDRNLGAEIKNQPLVLFTLQYGLEFSFPRFPVFLAATGTLSKNGLDGYGISLGMVTSF